MSATDPRLLAQQAEDLAANLRLALDSAGLGTWRWDLTTGAVVWDERLEELFGFGPGTFDGSFETYAASLHPEDRDRTLAVIDQSMEDRLPYRVEHRVVWPDGTVRWIAGTGKVTVGLDGEVTGAIGCSMDITTQVHARAEREAAAAAAIEAAEHERVHREHLEFLAQINDALTESHTRDEIMVNVPRAAVPRLGDWCSIFVLPGNASRIPDSVTYHADPEMVAYAETLRERFPFDPDAPTGMAKVLRSGIPEFFPRIDDDLLDLLDADGEARDLVRQLALSSSMAVPMIKHGRVIGGLQFVMTESRREYTESDLALAGAIAARIGASLENRRLAEEQRFIAKTLQDSLLPDELPDIGGLDLAVRYWAAGSAAQVGGDFYDVFATADDTWAAVIGDVCGTGPAAASLTALARHTIRLAGWRGDDPQTVLHWLNRALLEAHSGSFLTAAYLRMRRAGDAFDLEVACAGHPLPILVKADGSARMIGSPGSLLGVFEDLSTDTVAERLEPGDTLVLHTDGVTDVRPPYDLGPDELKALAVECVEGADGAEIVADCIHKAVAERLSIEQRGDDIALLVIQNRVSRS